MKNIFKLTALAVFLCCLVSCDDDEPIIPTLLISRVANASIYVCRADYTHKADYTLINELSEQKKLPNLCTLINGLDMKKKKYGYYYGYGKYGKYYGYGKKYGYGYGYGTENVNKK